MMDIKLRRISIIDGPIFKQYGGSKMGYRANIVLGDSNGADFIYQLHFRANELPRGKPRSIGAKTTGVARNEAGYIPLPYLDSEYIS